MATKPTTDTFYIARLSCGCVIDVCEDSLDWEALGVCLYHWLGNGYTVESVQDAAAIHLECAACKATPGRWHTQPMFSEVLHANHA